MFLLLSLGILIFWMIKSYISHNFIYDLFQNNTLEITEDIQNYGNISYLVFVFLIFLECIFAPFPPLILYIAGGTLFGGLFGGFLALIGNFLGAAVAFKISYYYGKEKILPRIPKKIREKFDKYSKKYGPASVFFLRINPLTSSDIFSYLAGLTNMSFWKFLAGTTLGLLPIVFLQTYLGETIQQHPLVTKISIIVGALYVLVFFVIYFWIRKKRK